ncbi:NAD-dependent protein deacetylase [Calidifontibacter terrae]
MTNSALEDGQGTEPAAEDLLRERVALGGVLALTGAGLSTASGLPDYRGADGVRRVQPMTVSEFRATVEARRRYWARSYAGWARFSAASPTSAHAALADLEHRGFIDHTITQNVDGLARVAGSRAVIELHGRLDEVICLRCRTTVAREWMQQEIERLNPGFEAAVGDARNAPLRPDGDVELDGRWDAQLRLVSCPMCGSDLLKPHVVMFGESVPRALVEQCFALVEAATTVVVIGSSLGVMSGYRFARHAVRRDIPVVLVNTGWSRAEDLATAHVHRDLQQVMVDLATHLPARPVAATN